MIKVDFINRWKSAKLFIIFIENKEKNSSFSNDHALQFYFGSIIPKKKYELTDELIDIYKKYTIVRPCDIVINGLNLNYDFVTQRIGLVTEQGIITSAYISLRCRQNFNALYYCYLFKVLDAQKLFHGMGTGIRLTLSYNELKYLELPVPPRDEQEQIVLFLDWKVSEINRLVNIKRQEIKALEELKQSIISHSVIKGLNSSTAKKYSETKWLGDIPIHWQLKKIGALFVERKIKVSDKDFAPLSVAKIGVVPQLETAVKTDAGDNRKLVCVGDFVINSRSDRKGSCGVSNLDGSVSLINIVLVPRDELNINYVHYLLRSQPFSEEYYRNGRGIVADLWTTRYSEMKSIMLPVPPFDEQEEIARFLDYKVSKINKLMNIKRNDIDSLNELKIKLIADVVTGKIDVRNIHIPNYEFSD